MKKRPATDTTSPLPLPAALVGGVFSPPSAPRSAPRLPASADYDGQSEYWILNRSAAVTAEAAKRHRISVKEHPFPHEGLCKRGFSTPQELMGHLRELGWKPASFTGTKDQFSRVNITLNGFTLTSFPSYAVAVASAKTPPVAGRKDSPRLAACPFCKRRDALEKIEWSNERSDGSEYTGPAVKCNRCDAIAPLPAWMAMGNG